MKKISVAVCDTDQAYGKKLGNGFPWKKEKDCEAAVFPNRKGFWNSGKSKRRRLCFWAPDFGKMCGFWNR